VNVVVHGAAGAMGKVLTSMLQTLGHTVIPVESVTKTSNMIQSIQNVSSCDVVIDFSHASLLPGVVAFCVNYRIPLVVGTTNLSESDQQLLSEAGQQIPLIESSNFAYGVAVLRRLVQAATAYLSEFDIELTETHHIHKKDSPSGTAKQLLRDIQQYSTKQYNVIEGRSSTSTAKAVNEIGVHSIRSGANPGEHTIIFSSNEEQIELTHKAFSRSVFAKGAIQAAAWVVTQPVGRYSIEEMVTS
jgi:4-hydroxy-tetrahydrodipicolinate reductase